MDKIPPKDYTILSPKEPPYNVSQKNLPPERPPSHTKYYVIIAVVFLIVVAADILYFSSRGGFHTNAPSANQPPASTSSSTPEKLTAALSEQPNAAKFSEYFSQFELEKLPAGKRASSSSVPVKTAVFTSGEQLCTNAMVVNKTIPKGSFASAIYDVGAMKDIQPKRTSPYALSPGVNFGCRALNLSAGKYEYKAYIGDVLVVVSPFAIK